MLGDLMSIEGTLWDEFERLRRDIDALFSPGLGLASIRAVARGSFPPLNVGATPEAVHIYLFAPGLDMNKVDVSIQRNLLTISGERKITAPEATGEGGYHLRERLPAASGAWSVYLMTSILTKSMPFTVMACLA
jgi:HSP20 family protein